MARTDRELLIRCLSVLDVQFQDHDERKSNMVPCWACRLRDEIRHHLEQHDKRRESLMAGADKAVSDPLYSESSSATPGPVSEA